MLSTPLLSIVIPTHKRAEILQRCLEHIERQTIAERLEVIVVNDGEKLKIENLKLKINFKIVDVPACHQGVARNVGVKNAKAERLLFIGDDIFLAPTACEKHLPIFNSQFSIFNSPAVLGFTTWDPTCDITPVMIWLEKSGWQFGYPSIQQFSHSTIPSGIQHHYTYTSHISLPTAIAKKFPFREDVTLYGWEDIEWGLRLKNAGVPLIYEPDAKALHHHHMTMEDSLKRMETLGRSAVVMERMVPELKLVPRGFKKWKYRIAAMMLGMRGEHARAFLRGMMLPVAEIIPVDSATQRKMDSIVSKWHERANK